MNKHTVLVPERKILVRRIAALTGLVPVYTRMPRYAYVIGSFAVEKDGTLVVGDEADISVIGTLVQEGMIAPTTEETASIVELDEPSAQQESAEQDVPDAEQEEQPTQEAPATTAAHAEDRAVLPAISFPLAQHTPESLVNLINMKP